MSEIEGRVYSATVSATLNGDGNIGGVVGMGGGGMTKHLLAYDGTSITEDGRVVSFAEVYSMLMEEPDFVVLVYNNFAYHPNGVSTEQIVFSASYPVSGLDVNHRITYLKNGTVTKTDSTDENIINKVTAITDLNKDRTDKYPSVKAMTDYSASKSDLQKQTEKLDALWKLNEGQTYDFVEDTTEAYSKTVPSGAKYASVDMVGGKSVVWNQLCDGFERLDFQSGVNDRWYSNNTVTLISTHKYVMLYEQLGSLTSVTRNTPLIQFSTGEIQYKSSTENYELNSGKKSWFFTPTKTGDVLFEYWGHTPNKNYSIVNVVVIDLTETFGQGNEPTTVDDPRIKFIETYASSHPEYNEGEIVSADVDSVVVEGRNLISDDSTYIETNKNIYVFGRETTGEGYHVKKGETYTVLVFSDNNASGIYITQLGSTGSIALAYNSKQLTYTFQEDAIIAINCYWAQGETNKKVMFIKGSSALPYSPYTKTTTPIPTAIRNLDGYGWSAGSVFNEVDYENKKYIKRVGRVDLGTLDWVASGFNPNGWKTTSVPNIKYVASNTMIGNAICDNYTIRVGSGASVATIGQFAVDTSYVVCVSGSVADGIKPNGLMHYELAEPIITDISDILTDEFLESLEVESGGTITLHQSNEGINLPVPNKTTYLRKLNEVTA